MIRHALAITVVGAESDCGHRRWKKRRWKETLEIDSQMKANGKDSGKRPAGPRLQEEKLV